VKTFQKKKNHNWEVSFLRTPTPG